MPLPTPETAVEVADRTIADVELAMAAVGARPGLENSWILEMLTGISFRQFDFYGQLDRAALEALPDTAIDLLDRWGAIYGVVRLPGQPSTGEVVVGGTVGKVIPKTTSLVTGSGDEYETTADATIAASSVALGTVPGDLTRFDDIANVKLVNHGLASNIKVTISGVTQTDYNLANVPITVVDKDNFMYLVANTPTSPATTSSSIFVSYNRATIQVKSVEFGDEFDLVLDDVLLLQEIIAGVDDVMNVDADGIVDGIDREGDPAFRLRLLDRIRNPVAHFNVADITARALTVTGVTRVFIKEIFPLIGQVTVYFMRDNDVNPIPGGGEVTAVKDVLDLIRPANMDPDDLIVSAPVAVPIDFTFTELTPNTGTMKASINASLAAFFAERVGVDQKVESDAYRSAIFNTVDTTTGEVVVSFELSTPGGDVFNAGTGNISTLGSISYAL